MSIFDSLDPRGLQQPDLGSGFAFELDPTIRLITTIIVGAFMIACCISICESIDQGRIPLFDKPPRCAKCGLPAPPVHRFVCKRKSKDLHGIKDKCCKPSNMNIYRTGEEEYLQCKTCLRLFDRIHF